jgi:two-component system, OmpR family, sensor kinase
MSGVLGLPALASVVLTVVTAAAVTGAAILAEVASRIGDGPRWSWTAAALALYGVVVLPIAVPQPGVDAPGPVVVRLVAHLTALLLLLASLRAPRRFGVALPWGLAAAGAVLAVAAPALPDTAVSTRAAVTALAMVLPVAWTMAAVGYVVTGRRRRSAPRMWLGLGLAVVAAAQVYKATTHVPVGDPVFIALRLLGVLVVLVALARFVIESVAAVRTRQWTQQEELAEAALDAEHVRQLAAERDHELRNGLAALTRVTHLLGSGADDEQRQLTSAVRSELGRLHGLVDHAEVVPAGSSREYAVEPVVVGLVTLRRSAGMPVAAHVDPSLRACGDPAVLAQVVTNLLANCDRHAPGAPVTVRAYRSGDEVVVEVRDQGPGLPPGIDPHPLRSGLHDPAAGGEGLGLHLSARLVERAGGELELRAGEPSGCVATVRLPAAEPTLVPPHPGGEPDRASSPVPPMPVVDRPPHTGGR